MKHPDLICPKCQSHSVTRHMTALPAQGEAELYAPAREEGYRCSACGHQEWETNFSDAYEALRNRWNDPLVETSTLEERQAMRAEMAREDEKREREFMWPPEWRMSDHERRAKTLAESREWSQYDRDAFRYSGLPEPTGLKYGHPVGDEFTRAILERPDDDAPRWNYARWLRTFDSVQATPAAEFIETQLRIAEAYRADPKCDAMRLAQPGIFDRKEPRRPGWLTRPDGADSALGESTKVLEDEKVIDDVRFYRGFVEHVAIRAERFLEIADELFALAPIRQLTLTYCKGRDHQDGGLWRALLASPHLERIRALRLPKRAFGKDNDYTELNRFSDGDLALLAQSPRLAGLRVLDLEDQALLTWRAFDALAESRNLPALSLVKHDIFAYGGKIQTVSFGLIGETRRTGPRRPLKDYAAELERRHGHRVWLHPVDYYGSEEPDIEAAIEHPVALATR